VRNLDTGEAIHVSEIDERIAAGQQPQSLRPLARVPPPAGFLASLFKVRVRVSVRVGVRVRVRVRVRVSLTLTLTPNPNPNSHQLGPAPVPLEPCLRPLPPLSIAGDLTNGSHLRLVVAR